MQIQCLSIARIQFGTSGECVGFKRQLQSLKRELKGWEAVFERKHGHKPTKVCLVWSHDSLGTGLQ